VTLGWALVGTGAIARSRMAPAIARHGRIAAVVSTSAERAGRFADATGAPRFYTALADALADDAVDAVYVSTTNELHAEQAIACLRAGRHVLCEKPMALSLEDADAMIAAAAESGRTLAVNHHLRAAESLERMRSLVAAGAVGRPRLIRALHRCLVRPERRGNWRMTDPRRGAGVILDLTVHTVDAIRFVTGREVASLHGHAAPDGIELAVAGTLRLEGDVLVSLADAYSPLPPLSAIEIDGDDGRLEARGVLDGNGRATIVVGDQVIECDDDPYGRTVERFAAGRPAATGADGRAALAVALALRSAVSDAPRRPA
jgi:1,5-anhydro-D-fructose reductase (1,5-anhydro-D-mannitol-forming)